MADPHHIPVLDGFDRWTVQVYRAGLATSSVGLLGLAAALLLDPTGSWRTGAQVLVVAGCALSISCMHLYDKRIRWVIAASGWTGAVLLLTAQGAPASIGHWIHHAGLGFVFVSLSGFAVKEQFCFRLPALRLVPVLLALSLIPLLGRWDLAAALLLGLSGLIYGAMAVAKTRMPLHFDIGDKSRYQV